MVDLLPAKNIKAEGYLTIQVSKRNYDEFY